MDIVDIVFPRQIGPLTYRVPPDMRERMAPGLMVEAPLQRSVARGIVLRQTTAPPGVALRSIKSIYDDIPALGPAMLGLIGWLADYYCTTEGMALKSIFPQEFFKPSRPRASRKIKIGQPPPELATVEFDAEARDELAGIGDCALRRMYRTYLLEAPSSRYENAFLIEAVRGIGGCAIVLCPDIGRVERISYLLSESIGPDTVVPYHSGLSAGRRSEAIGRIRRGEAKVVVGSRLAVFAPMPAPSLIAVLSEESTSYKDEGGIRFHARDAAVMRGYLENAPVLLSSICPSIESRHNAVKGKYRIITPLAPRAPRPDMRLLPAKAAQGGIAPRLKTMVTSTLKLGGRVLFVIRRKGYSMLRCAECGHLPECPRCGIGLEYSKSPRARLFCRICNEETPLPQACPACGGHEIGPSGVGMERIEDELAALGPVRLDQGHGPIEALSGTHGLFAMGSPLAIRKETGDEGYDLIAVLNADAYMHIPDFRAMERAFSDLLHAIDALAPGGRLVVQSRYIGAPLFGYVRRFDRAGFYEEEIAARREHGYPPFWNLALVMIASASPPECPRIKGVEVMGPAPSGRPRDGLPQWKFLLKAPARATLRKAVRAMVKDLEPQGYTVDIDPVFI